MGEASSLFLRYGMDVAEVVRGSGNIRRELAKTDRATRQSDQVWGGFTGRLAKTALVVQGIREVTGIVMGVGRAIVNTGKVAADEAAGQQRLALAVRNTGRAFTDADAAGLEQWISGMESATAIADDDLRSALSLIVAQTGDLEDAQRRLKIATDLSAGADIDLITASRALGKINEDSIGTLSRLFPDLQKFADGTEGTAVAQELAAKAGISYAEAMGVVQKGGKEAESVYKRWNVQVKSGIDEQAVLGAVSAKVAGQAAKRAEGPAGQYEQWTLQARNLREEIGNALTPTLTRGASFGVKALRAFRHAFMLLSTDVTGPRLGTAQKIWKAAFGTEMPAALSTLFDGVGKVADRISKFIDDLAGASDKESVLKAVQGLASDIKTTVSGELTKLGQDLDQLGIVGFGIKVVAGSFVVDKIAGLGIGAVGGILGIVKDVLQVAWLTTALAGSAITLTVGAGIILGIAAFNIIDQVEGLRGVIFHDENFWRGLMGLFGVGVGIAFAVGATPIALTLAAGAIISFAATQIIAGQNVTRTGSIDKWLIAGLFGLTAAAVVVTMGAALPVAITLGAALALVVGATSVTQGQAPNSSNDRALCEAAGGTWDTRYNYCVFRPVTGPSPAPAPAPPAAPPVPPPAPPAGPPVPPPPQGPEGPVPIGPPPGIGPRIDEGIITPSSPKATLDDIYVAYERITGATINFEYAKSILDRGFTYADAASKNIFAAGGMDAIVGGAAGAVNIRAGEAGLERVRIEPLHGGGIAEAPGGRSGPLVVNVYGDVDSEQRAEQMGRDFWRKAAALGLVTR